MMARVLELDLAGGIRAFRSMLRGLIAMPGRFMDDGRDPDLFDHFAIIAQRINVSAVRDDVSIIDHLKAWNITGRSGDGWRGQGAGRGLPPGRTVRADGRPDGCRRQETEAGDLPLAARSKGVTRR
jgi:Fatty acid desaturase